MCVHFKAQFDVQTPVKASTSSVKTNGVSWCYVIHVVASTLYKQEMADYCPQCLRRANLISEISISCFLSSCLTVDLQMCRQADGAHHLRSGCARALNASVDEPFFTHQGWTQCAQNSCV